jgi:hypothetical protein
MTETTRLLKMSPICHSPSRMADIIFVHGLGGSPRGTWHPKGKENDDNFWLTWLGEDFQNCGIWSLGYEVEPFRWRGETMPLVDRATNILALLDAHDIGSHPILFITHSMGGLLIKQLLRQAYDYGNPDWRAIAEATQGIIYLSTPHSGSGLANWIDKMGILQSSVSVEELQAHHPRLRELNEVYRNHEQLRAIKIQVYCEKKKIKGFLVVDETSANPGIPGVTPVPTDCDHLSICRPDSRESLVYLGVRKFIQRCSLDINSAKVNAQEKSQKSLTSGSASQIFVGGNYIGDNAQITGDIVSE